MLSDGSPCGAEDITFSPEFEQLQDEAEKSDSIYGGTPTDWEAVLTYATNILQNSAKDIWVLCYGCRAAYEQGGLPWFIAALDILNSYLEKNWDELHPQRPGRRIAAFQWLANKFDALLPAGTFPAENAEIYETLRGSLGRLQDILNSRLGEKAPSLRTIIQAIPPPPAPAGISAESKPSQPQTPVPPAILPPQPVSADILAALDNSGLVPPSILPQLLRSTTDQTRQLADHYLAQNSTDWRAYILHRISLWTTIAQLPQAGSDKVTPLRPVPKDKQIIYQNAVQSKQYAAILPPLERSAGNQPYWFDGHYLVVQCLEGLGAEVAGEAVCFVLKHFLDIYPDLTSYKYFDSSPFASPETLQWLEGLRARNIAGGDIGTAWLPGGFLDKESKESGNGEGILNAAIIKGQKEGFDTGLAMLGESLGTRSRGAVKRGILLARYCLSMNKTKAAKELLTALYEQLEQWGLIDWEPELSAQIIALLKAANKGQPGKEYAPMLRKLHWLHFHTAIQINSE